MKSFTSLMDGAFLLNTDPLLGAAILKAKNQTEDDLPLDPAFSLPQSLSMLIWPLPAILPVANAPQTSSSSSTQMSQTQLVAAHQAAVQTPGSALATVFTPRSQSQVQSSAMPSQASLPSRPQAPSFGMSSQPVQTSAPAMMGNPSRLPQAPSFAMTSQPAQTLAPASMGTFASRSQSQVQSSAMPSGSFASGPQAQSFQTLATTSIMGSFASRPQVQSSVMPSQPAQTPAATLMGNPSRLQAPSSTMSSQSASISAPPMQPSPAPTTAINKRPGESLEHINVKKTQSSSSSELQPIFDQTNLMRAEFASRAQAQSSAMPSQISAPARLPSPTSTTAINKRPGESLEQETVKRIHVEDLTSPTQPSISAQSSSMSISGSEHNNGLSIQSDLKSIIAQIQKIGASLAECTKALDRVVKEVQVLQSKTNP